MPETATLSSRFTTRIPEALRERQGWEAGQELVLLPQGRGVLLIPALDDLRGIARGADPSGYRERG